MMHGQEGSIVFLLWHSAPNEPADDEYDTDDKLLGVFDSEEAAEAAKAKAAALPGFRAWPDKFLIDRMTVNQLAWSEGFARQLPGGVWADI